MGRQVKAVREEVAQYHSNESEQESRKYALPVVTGNVLGYRADKERNHQIVKQSEEYTSHGLIYFTTFGVQGRYLLIK